MAFIKDCGIMLEPQEGTETREMLDVTRVVERSGFGYLFRSDHLLPTSRKKNLDSPECWVTLGAIAAYTKNLKFGPMVSPIGFRNPAVLGRMALTVNSMSAGRLQLGLGAGWYEDEYLAHGIPFPSIDVRKAQFHEALQIIRPLTLEGKVEFNGKYFSAHLEDLPRLERKVHMIIGSKAPSIIRETLGYADEWNFVGPVPTKFESLRKELKSAKREIEISKMGQFIIGDSNGSLKRRVRAEMKRRGVSKDESAFTRELVKAGCMVATSKDFAGEVNRLRDAGVEKIYFQTWDTRDRAQIDLLASVLKAL